MPNVDSHLSSEVGQMIHQAEDLFNAALFSEAIPLYEKILQSIDKESGNFILEKSLVDKIDSKVRFKLAQAFFQIKDYKAAAAILCDHASLADHQFFLGIAYRKNNDFDQAIDVFRSYLNHSSEAFLVHRDEVFLELALAFYYKKDFANAQQIFEKVIQTVHNPRILILSNFHLAKIKMKQQFFDEAILFLANADKLLDDENILKYESAFLKGKLYYTLKNYEKAIHFFEKALPSLNTYHAKWCADTLFYIGMSYIKLADKDDLPEEKMKGYFKQAELALSKLLEIKPKERAWLAQGKYFLAAGLRLKDEASLKKADEIFSDPTKMVSQEFKYQAALLKAQAHSHYSERDRRFRQLTQPANINSPVYGDSWYLKGLNDFNEGKKLKSTNKKEESQKLLERAAFSFEKVSDSKIDRPSLIAEAVLLQAYTYNELETNKDRYKALNALNQLWKENGKLSHALADPLEAYILYSHIASSLADETDYLAKLQQGIDDFPKSPNRANALSLWAALLYKKGEYAKAEEIFVQIAQEWPLSSLAADALFRAAQCAEKLQKDKSIVQSYKKKILDQYPSSLVAPEAYFTMFSYQEYLQGDRQALKHLQTFLELYPESPFVLNVLFLIGLDNKRERKTSDGKRLRKKNLLYAIDNFQEVESHFVNFFLNEKIPDSEMEHYLLIKYRAHLEKGIANYIQAKESSRAKKQIYLEYAQDSLSQLIEELNQENSPYKKWMVNLDSFWHLEEEAAYWLSQAYVAANMLAKAENVLSDILEKYNESKITRGYFLSRTWSTKGTILMRKNEHEKALECFLQAEDSSKGKVLSTDQRLELLILQSICLKELNQLEKAILILSKVVNDEAVSSLRVKAMFLRAEIYEKQERYEIARKQLEATSKKGGSWALKAKEKLEKEYGY